MKLFLKRILIFFLPIFMMLAFLEYALLIIPNSYSVKGNYLEQNSTNINTLVLGSSHTFYAANPKYFDSKTFNASNVSQSPDIDYAILKSYEDQLTQLKTVVIRLSYDTLFEQLKNSNEDWRLKFYKIYTQIRLDYAFKHSYSLLSMGTRQSIKVASGYYINNEPLLDCDSLGWGNDIKRKPKRNIEAAGYNAAKRHTANTWDLLETNINVFKDLLDWCLIRNIEVLLVTPPAYKSYVTNLNESQLNKMVEVGKALDKTYSNCTYYNLLSNMAFKAEDFYDADHLNARGAKKFSLMINDLIEN